MSLLWLIVVVLVIAAIVGAPGIGYSHGYGWFPSGGIGLVVVVLLILLLIGRL